MTAQEEPKTTVLRSGGGGADAVYAIGMIGAWVYYFKRAATTEERVLAVLKGFVWPAFLVYNLMAYLNKEQDNGIASD